MPKTAVEVKELFTGLKEGIAEETTAQSELRTAMTVLIYHCNRYDHIDNGLEVNENNYDDEFEFDKEKKKAEIAAIYLERLKLLNDIASKANALGEDPGAMAVGKKVKELSEEYLKSLSDYENEKENEAIDKDVENMSEYEKKAYTELKNEGLRTIGGKDGTKVFNEKGIQAKLDEIKNSANFKHMMSGVNDWDEFMNLKDEISYANNLIIDRLAKSTKALLEAENPKQAVQQPNKIVKTNNIKL